ncbi:MAG: hypothetical protein H6867_06050 [Rhodospirillales bacterium]|nr:hypothetical protein [Rhodospirillales bacterium]MCB9995091.1 hypothetical protein [Rhodospirillales bacterium]
MADHVSYVYVRLSDGARPSQIDLAAAVLEDFIGAVTLEKDGRDNTVYCVPLPADLSETHRKQIISTLVTRSFIDEAWLNDGLAATTGTAQFHLK